MAYQVHLADGEHQATQEVLDHQDPGETVALQEHQGLTERLETLDHVGTHTVAPRARQENQEETELQEEREKLASLTVAEMACLAAMEKLETQEHPDGTLELLLERWEHVAQWAHKDHGVSPAGQAMDMQAVLELMARMEPMGDQVVKEKQEHQDTATMARERLDQEGKPAHLAVAVLLDHPESLEQLADLEDLDQLASVDQVEDQDMDTGVQKESLDIPDEDRQALLLAPPEEEVHQEREDTPEERENQESQEERLYRITQ